jgi:hypothetical protein
MNADEVWINEFGNKGTAKDFAGRIVKRTDYLGNFSQGQKIPTTAWDLEHIHPLNPNGNEEYKKKHTDISYYQVANVTTNREKSNKTSFRINDVPYQVVKNTPKHTQGKHIAPYPYKDKKYCIVILDN